VKLKDVIAVVEGQELKRIEKAPKKEYAILLPLIEKEDGLHLLFQVRAQTIRKQPGDVCFPGGEIEVFDASKMAAAIRETSEELGLPSDSIANVYPLDYMIDTVAIYPFVGKLTHPEQIQINPDEVAEIFTIPLNFFLVTPPVIHSVSLTANPGDDFPYHLIEGGKDYKWYERKLDIPFYKYQDRVIWGLTARILQHFIETLKSLD